MSENLIIKLDWDKNTTSPPNFSELKNFVSAFEMLFAELDVDNEVIIKEGSYDLFVTIVAPTLTSILASSMFSALTHPKTDTQCESVALLQEIRDMFAILIDSKKVNLPHLDEKLSQPKIMQLEYIKYKVISHKFIKEECWQSGVITSDEIKKTIALIEFLEGEFAGKRFEVITECVDEAVEYYANFTKNGKKLAINSEPFFKSIHGQQH